jgi:GTP-binding protein YchF
MSIDIGIIGLPKSGRTTVFNALTRGDIDIGCYTPEARAAHVGVAKVPDPRLQSLADIFCPKKVVPAEARYVDIGASVKDLASDRGIGGELLNQLSSVAALFHVVRNFVDERIPHIEGSLDVERDIANMNLELAFSDLVIIERRMKRIEESLKGAKSTERQILLREQDLLRKISGNLENNIPIRELSLTAEEDKTISNYQFLTAKPLLIVINIGEEQTQHANILEKEICARYAKEECNIITICGKLEMELAQLDEEAAGELRCEFGVGQSGLERAIRESYRLLGLVTFFTMASEEVKAWPVRNGTAALKAAGKIHSDMERGFIRAEVIGYDEMIRCGSLAEARKMGLLRLEGKNYTVKDGDVVNFLFNV